MIQDIFFSNSIHPINKDAATDMDLMTWLQAHFIFHQLSIGSYKICSHKTISLTTTARSTFVKEFYHIKMSSYQWQFCFTNKSKIWEFKLNFMMLLRNSTRTAILVSVVEIVWFLDSWFLDSWISGNKPDDDEI